MKLYSVLGLLHRVNVGDVAGVHAASNLMVDPEDRGSTSETSAAYPHHVATEEQN
jgi:hypothetical protein